MRALLHFLEWRLGLAPATSWMLSEERALLLRHAAKRRRLAEVGVWEGGTTCGLRQVMAPDATLYAIDPYPSGRLGFSYQKAIAAGEVARVRNGRVVWLRQTGVDAARDPGVRAAPFDFVFLDGDHTYEAARDDWEAWSPLIAADGVVALHDSVATGGGDPPGSVRYGEAVIARDPRFEPVEIAGSLRVLRRR